MKKLIITLVIIVIAILLFLVIGPLYIVEEGEQAVVVRFGRIVQVQTEAGLKTKVPFLDKVKKYPKKILSWDGEAQRLPTVENQFIWVDTTARWKIADSLKFLQSVGNEIGAHARLDDIIDSATRDAVTNHLLVEAVRDTNRVIDEYDETADADTVGLTEDLERISLGREALTRDILKEASVIVPQYGIELIDVRIKRINYVEDVQKKVFERMASERKRAAEQYRSEGQGKKAEIEGKREKELNQIRSEAYKVAQEIKGKADAEATNIYANAYNKDPEFYSFMKTLETYENTIDEEATIILTTDSEYLQYLKDAAKASQ